MFKQIVSLLVVGSALATGSAHASTHCETIVLENNTVITQCDEIAFPEESEACNAFSSDYGTDIAMAYEACMVIAIHTPDAVHF